MAHGGLKNVKGHKDHGKRAHGPSKAVRKARQKAQDPRYLESMEATRKAREALDELIAAQADNPAIGETPGAIYQRRQRELALERAQALEDEYARAELASEEPVRLSIVKKAPEPKIVEVECDRVYVKQTHKIDTKALPQDGEGNWRFSYQTALIMVKEGYNIAHVIKYTGVGYEDLKHLPLDDEGYYLDPDSLEGEDE
jgi:hypothetical protein